MYGIRRSELPQFFLISLLSDKNRKGIELDGFAVVCSLAKDALCHPIYYIFANLLKFQSPNTAKVKNENDSKI